MPVGTAVAAREAHYRTTRRSRFAFAHVKVQSGLYFGMGIGAGRPFVQSASRAAPRTPRRGTRQATGRAGANTTV